MRILFLVAALSGCAHVTTDWAGSPVTNNNDAWFPQDSWLPALQMGFRSDGVVVWRLRKL